MFSFLTRWEYKKPGRQNFPPSTQRWGLFIVVLIPSDEHTKLSYKDYRVRFILKSIGNLTAQIVCIWQHRSFVQLITWLFHSEGTDLSKQGNYILTMGPSCHAGSVGLGGLNRHLHLIRAGNAIRESEREIDSLYCLCHWASNWL